MLAWEGFWCIGGAGYTLVYTGDKEHSNKDLTKILPRYIAPAREKVDSMEKRIFGILQKSSYITLGSLSCHTIVLFRNCVLLPWPARILVYSLANYSCHNNNTIQVLLLFQHYCCKPVAQLHSAQKKTMKQPKAGKCHFFRNCSWFAPWPISLVTIILF